MSSLFSYLLADFKIFQLRNLYSKILNFPLPFNKVLSAHPENPNFDTCSDPFKTSQCNPFQVSRTSKSFPQFCIQMILKLYLMIRNFEVGGPESPSNGGGERNIF